MTADPVETFLGTLVVNRRSRYSYATPLRSFAALATTDARAGNGPSVATITAWLRRDAARSPFANVVERAAVISRYLDWRAVHGAGPNRLAELRRRHGGRLAPIVRALLDEDPERALERLTPLPEYGSRLGSLIRRHIERMRSLGHKYEAKARDLQRLDRFLQLHPALAEAPLTEVLGAWRSAGRTARHQLRVQQCGRALTRAQHRQDLTTDVLTIEHGLQRRAIEEERKPYVFTEAEVDRLFLAARSYPSERAPWRPRAVTAMLTLAYCAGLRVGEIARLTLGDVDLGDGAIDIRDTKFFKSRRLPLSPSVVHLLQDYLAARVTWGAPTTSDAPLWWTPLRRKGYSYSQIDKMLTRVLKRAGLKPARGTVGPRVHDLRHTFVGHRMLQWYREGVDVQARLPYLATYLGHKDIVSTLVYLNITPELLAQAGERYRQRGREALGHSGGLP
jgi:integrase/recombinase XerD